MSSQQYYPILLRSRSKPGESSPCQHHPTGSPDKGSQSLINTESSGDKDTESRSIEFGRSMSKNRANTLNLRTVISVCVLIVFLLGAYTHFMIFEYERQRTMSDKIPRSVIVNGRPQIPAWRVLNESVERGKKGPSTTNNKIQTRSLNTLSTVTPPQRQLQLRKLPLVDRAILDKLDRIHKASLLDDPSPAAPARWPPTISRIPEPPRSSSLTNLKTAGSLCESPAHPRACRFLFPLRIAEQESKAQIHFLQLLQLAKSLNRILVLPNVGKSKIGACFKWGFNAYYDESGLGTSLEDKEWFVKQDTFRDWVNYQDPNTPLKAQLVSISSGLPSTHTKILQLKPTYTNQDVDVHAYNTYGTWQSELPGCFTTKFQRLDVGSLPVFMSVKTSSTSRRDINSKPLGDSVLDAFSAIVFKFLPNFPDNEPPVIIINWDLRHPVFTTSFPNQMLTLPYSTAVRNLAERLEPVSPYLAVHWRMETVDPDLLPECAHALVDVLSRILHEEEHNSLDNEVFISRNITRTIWFASDYPYPIARRTPTQARPAIIAKSGTFKNFEVRHEEAVNILRDAFDHEHGELRKWKLTDFVESVELRRVNKGPNEEELLQDSGVSSILDKLISIKAATFISGSNKCGRKSSFTKQVVDARKGAWHRTQATYLKNIVNTFG